MAGWLLLELEHHEDRRVRGEQSRIIYAIMTRSFHHSASLQVQCLLWDFGDTLCDELSLWRESPEWMAIYRSFDDGIGAAWNLGDLDTQAFVTELAKRMPLSESEILAHLERTELFDFFPFTYAFFRNRHLPQAIVTVNPTFFTEVIEPAYALDEVTDTIIVSGEERTIDKGELCQRALDRMNLGCDPSQALLIDNKHLEC